ncbi:hypothetical protein M011DRAFT_423898 [Sporormia fimetaria CBS 119925]|uniref:Camp independent regulatory protein n=1 Tax=Sporormia fimetaria CBS 119925 TaxID=1340428 RepID=A0A6A6V8S3_9PLEO|nr:hypothetical protein M011DRAFT_423898 [Sporormia fimetaria CBS 119925]
METYHGHVRTPADAILLFEACRIGLLPRVQRRLSEKERQQIKSGSVFVWDEREAGMRRWTDGKSWSASRVSGSFLTYREMEGKRSGNNMAVYPTGKPADKQYMQASNPGGRSIAPAPNGESDGESGGPDGYRYKPDGLMKQSFSITTQAGQHLHLISYYSRSHSQTLPQPTNDPSLRHINIPKSMYPESSISEPQPGPPVARAPVPEPQPQYPPGTQATGSQSPYSRPQHQPAVIFAPFPGPPTPPYQGYFIQGPPPMYQPGHPVYYTHSYPPTIQHMDRLPPHMAGPYPQVAHPAYAGYPPPPQHMSWQPPPRPIHGSPEHPHLRHPQHPPQPRPYHASPRAHPLPDPSIPEHGPVLPAINTINTKPPSPQPSDPKSADSLNVPETNGTNSSQNGAPSPSRTIPTIHTLLNDVSHDVDNTNGHHRNSDAANGRSADSNKTSNGQTASPPRSPRNTQLHQPEKAAREMPVLASPRAVEEAAVRRN